MLVFRDDSGLSRGDSFREEIEIYARADSLRPAAGRVGYFRGRSVPEEGISDNTFYRWKRQFAGMGVAELRRLKILEDENRRLKQLVADLALDKEMLQDVLRKKL